MANLNCKFLPAGSFLPNQGGRAPFLLSSFCYEAGSKMFVLLIDAAVLSLAWFAAFYLAVYINCYFRS